MKEARGCEPNRKSAEKFTRAELMPRVLSALVLVGLAVAAAVVGGHWFALFWLIAAAAVLWEWLTLVGETAGRRACLLVGAVALAIAAALTIQGAADYGLAVIAIADGAIAVVASKGRRLWCAGGLLYASAAVLPITALRGSLLFGLPAVLWVFAVVWGTDIGAYFGGRLLAGPKLWPAISPSKTWSGFVCGVLSGALAGLAVAPAVADTLRLLAFGVATGTIVQIGDLFESALKRRFGVKDTSALIPGHGGVMDRLDGFIAASLFAAVLGSVRAGLAMPAQGLFR
jgi:phosphatidate cytidylyltransferase